jgi:hypothetical protein
MVVALRSYVSAFHTGSGEAFDVSDRRFAELRQTGDIDGLGELLLSAFTIAARRRFAPMWYPSDIIRFVAQIRCIDPEGTSHLNAVVAENQLRIALGQQVAPHPDMEARGRAQMLLLGVITVGYTHGGLDELMREAQVMASQSRVGGLCPARDMKRQPPHAMTGVRPVYRLIAPMNRAHATASTASVVLSSRNACLVSRMRTAFVSPPTSTQLSAPPVL